MRIRLCLLPTLLLFLGPPINPLFAQQNSAPHLEKRGSATQLIVDGKPFLILGGELHNSSSSSLEYMKPIWPRLAAMALNTVVTPLSWELIEPKEGTFDFSLVDGLLAQARNEHERIVFLWLASWKNGMSSYAPVWVKQDTRRFPRVVEHGSEVEILSPAGNATQEADARAFAALMQHIKEVDSRDHTVLMMQVENEVGVLGDTRDHSDAANHAFDSPVPEELTRYLKAHHDTLYPRLQALWDANGDKTTGTWAQVFGNTEQADEIFMAWQYARFIQAVAAQGKAAYNIPMYVNTWLAGDDSTPAPFPADVLSHGLSMCGRLPVRRLISTRPISTIRTLSCGPDATIATATLFSCPKQEEAKPELRTSSTRSARRQASVFPPSASTTKIRWMPGAISLPATARLPALPRCSSNTRARATCTVLCSTRITLPST